MLNYKEFIQSILTEDLHPELKELIKSSKSSNYGKKKQTVLANKIKDITDKGEKTGIEGNMPKGSSRAYLKHEETHHLVIDGKKTSIKVGTKVAIRADLDKYHDKVEHDGKSLGQLQNEAEGGDHFINDHYRILRKDHEKEGHYNTNHENGIFPPLNDHDHENHEWSKVGHVRDIKKSEFKELTKTESHPKGISHEDFTKALRRKYDQNHGKNWGSGDEKHEEHMDHVEEHPLVQKFLDHQYNYGAPPHDYEQIKNLGVFEHNGEKHIVARDHGFNDEVMKAYRKANKKKYGNRFI
jgi:hypothetical protein